MRGVLDQLKVRGRKDPKANIFQLLRDRLCDVAQGPWLVILDNADDARVLLGTPPTSEQADKSAFNARLDCIPPCSNGQLLITSRTAEAAKQLVDWNDMIVVKPMSENQALTLLCNKLGIEHSKEDALQLARELDFMPLALTQAAAYIRQSAGRCTIKQYLERLKRCDAIDESVLDLDERDLRRDRESSNSIMLTWQVTFNQIREIHPSAADLLSLMSIFDHQAIPENLLHKRGSGDASGGLSDWSGDFDKDLAVLRSYFLVPQCTDAKSFKMQRLMQLATKKWLKARGQLRHWGSQFVSNLDEIFPLHSHELENWGTCQSLFPHAIAVLGTEVTDRKAILLQAGLLLRSGRYATAKGNYSYAQDMLERSSRARKDMLGEQKPETLTSMNSLARAYADQGQWVRAHEIWQEVVERRKEVLGTDHSDTLVSMSEFAEACFSCRQPNKAGELQLQVLEKTKRLLGEEHEHTLMSMNCLGNIYTILGRCEEAERLHEEVIERRKKTLGEFHPSTLKSKSGLAWTYVHQERYEEAETLHAEVVKREKAVLGEEHPSTLMSMDALSWVYMKQGRWADSWELQLTVIEKRIMVLVQGHPLTLRSMAKLAYLLRALGRPESALNLISACLYLSPHTLGPDHDDVKDYSQFKTRCETELSSQAGAKAACDPTDRLVGDGAGIVPSVRNVFAAMKLG